MGINKLHPLGTTRLLAEIVTRNWGVNRKDIAFVPFYRSRCDLLNAISSVENRPIIGTDGYMRSDSLITSSK